MKAILNKIIDMIFEKKRVKKKYKPLTNKSLSDGLANGKLFVACIKSRNNNFVSRMITKFSGPYSHVVAVFDSSKYEFGSIEMIRLTKKLKSYYANHAKYIMEYLVLASADDNGMNYFSISEYQNREMIVFNIPEIQDTNTDTIGNISSYSSRLDDIIHELLSEKVMNANYDYTGLVGQIFKPIKKIGKLIFSLFDDERAYYCSEQADIFRKHGVKLADKTDPTPTEIYNYCKNRYPVVYSSLTR